MPSFAISSSWEPRSAIFPSETTAISVAFLTVERRCATTMVVLPLQSSSSECWIRISVVLSRALVASSRMRIGGFFRKTRAIERRCFYPPERRTPRSPISVS